MTPPSSRSQSGNTPDVSKHLTRRLSIRNYVSNIPLVICHNPHPSSVEEKWRLLPAFLKVRCAPPCFALCNNMTRARFAALCGSISIRSTILLIRRCVKSFTPTGLIVLFLFILLVLLLLLFLPDQPHIIKLCLGLQIPSNSIRLQARHLRGSGPQFFPVLPRHPFRSSLF